MEPHIYYVGAPGLALQCAGRAPASDPMIRNRDRRPARSQCGVVRSDPPMMIFYMVVLLTKRKQYAKQDANS
eukprot:466473-Hanusia_phi.AAC.1